MDAATLAVSLEGVNYLFSLIDQVAKVKELISKPGGTTKEDFAKLVAYHESERKRIGDYIDSLPDDTHKGN